jgi:hypothetical protein
MAKNADYDALLAELEALRSDVAQLRAQQAGHVCYAPTIPWLAQTFANTGCAAPVPQVFMTAPSAEPQVFTCDYFNTAGAAGGAGMQTFILNAGA